MDLDELLARQLEILGGEGAVGPREDAEKRRLVQAIETSLDFCVKVRKYRANQEN